MRYLHDKRYAANILMRNTQHCVVNIKFDLSGNWPFSLRHFWGTVIFRKRL